MSEPTITKEARADIAIEAALAIQTRYVAAMREDRRRIWAHVRIEEQSQMDARVAEQAHILEGMAKMAAIVREALR